MEDFAANLPGLGTLFAWVVAGTVFFIQKAKQFLCQQVKAPWSQRVPWWVWVAASLLIPVALIALMTQRWAQDLVNPLLPETLRIHVTFSQLPALALSAMFGSTGSYALAKKWGLTGDYKPGGPKDVTGPIIGATMPVPGEPATENSSVPATAPVVPPGPATPLGVVVAPETPELATEPVLLLSTTIVDPEYVYVDGQLRAVKESESKYLAGPSERSPHHVFVPRDWLKSKQGV